MNLEQKIPRVNANDDEAELTFWYVEEGEFVQAGQDLADIETMKAAMTVQAEGSGYLRRLKQAKEVVAVGETFAVLLSEAPAESDRVPQTEGVPGSLTGPRFSRAARALLEESGLDAGLFQGQALVTLEQVQAELNGPRLRRERSGRSKEAEIRALSAQPEALPSCLTVVLPGQHLRASDIPASARLLYEIAQLVRQRPAFTAYYQAGEVFYYDRVDLGWALDAGKGLKVARVMQADSLELEQWPQALEDRAAAYLENTLTVEDLTLHTLTVTDLSGYDIYQFQPLLNGKQSVIVGIGGDRQLPGEPFTVTVAFDHRVLSGREVAEFLQALKKRVEPGTAPQCCDRCLISLSEYYQSMARDALMRVYARADGTHGLLCHVCASGY